MAPTMVLCPYCGSLSTHAKQCTHCHGYFDLLSRQRSQNAMGPWFIRDVSRPFQPGCSYPTLVKMIQRGRIKPETVIRGPATRQFWTFAKNAPGIAHLMGECHSCHASVMPIAKLCPMCRASFVVDEDRQNMGLSPVHLLPGDADAATIAASLGAKGATPTIPTTPPPEMHTRIDSNGTLPSSLPPRAPQPVATHPPQHAADANHTTTQSQPMAEPVKPNFPEPEVKVILADDTSGGSGARLLVMISIAFVVVLGAGVWAWSYLSERAGPDATLVMETSEGTTDDATLDGSDTEPLTPQTGGEEDQAGEESDPDTLVEGSGGELDQPPQIDPPAPDQPDRETREGGQQANDAGQLAYDRALLGLARGTLNEDEFRELVARVSPTQREELEELWVRRLEQLRLGRNGG